ncbi:MAG: RecX family transcriptional regulator [Cyclobacteriaceae bacterium]|nr:RecX family transcriptional regulator [Cyclobacteriaceae bacterium]MCH8515713.1 RecX family transcriptional regulator [Cyclobacteriaceae bacterium]
MREELKHFIHKAAAFCAYQDRCQKELAEKLKEWGATADEADEVLCEMILEKFIDEERFSQSFTRGKFHYKKWGRLKIRQALNQKDISSRNIDTGLNEIDPVQYREVATSLLLNKYRSVESDPHPLKRKQKTLNFMQSKGFEISLCLEIYDEVVK